MWLFTNEGCVSIVEDFANPKFLWVRSRTEGQIEAVGACLPPKSFTVKHTPENDYAYRAKMTRAQVEHMVLQQVRGIDYTNFKDSIKDNEYHSACSKVWWALVDACGTGCYAAKQLLAKATTKKRKARGKVVRNVSYFDCPVHGQAELSEPCCKYAKNCSEEV